MEIILEEQEQEHSWVRLAKGIIHIMPIMFQAACPIPAWPGKPNTKIQNADQPIYVHQTQAGRIKYRPVSLLINALNFIDKVLKPYQEPAGLLIGLGGV